MLESDGGVRKCARAARNNELMFLIELRDHGSEWDASTTTAAALFNSWDCFMYAVDSGCPLDFDACSVSQILHGHGDMRFIQWYWEHGTVHAETGGRTPIRLEVELAHRFAEESHVLSNNNAFQFFVSAEIILKDWENGAEESEENIGAGGVPFGPAAPFGAKYSKLGHTLRALKEAKLLAGKSGSYNKRSPKKAVAVTLSRPTGHVVRMNI
jgi:hypothetical protein